MINPRTLLKSFATIAVFAVALPVYAQAPVGVDGVLGSEWTGVTPTYVSYSASAPENNFSAGPVTNTDSVGYNIYVRSDATYFYGALQTDPSAGASSTYEGAPATWDFSNLYFGSTGATLGIEITNDRAFIPGVSGFTDLSTSGFAFSSTTSSDVDTVEFAIPWSFLETDPLHMGFAPFTPGTKFAIRDSQSFGYTYSGDPSLSNRYGAAIAPSLISAPEPSSVALLSVASIGLCGLIAVRRRSSKTISI